MNIRPSALIKNKGAFLFLRYHYPEGVVYALPGGGQEQGESLIETLERELKEELNLTIEVGSMQWVCEMQPQGKIMETLHLIFNAEIVPHQSPVVNKEHTSANGFEWLKPGQFTGKLFYPNIGDALEKECDLLTDKHEKNNLPRSPPTYLGVCPTRKWA